MALPAFHTAAPAAQLMSIQYLRGLAALSVLVTHVLQWPLPDTNMPLLMTGRLGVEVFFVVSGFIMTVVVGDGRFDPLDFLRRRVIRIVPAYWAATLLVTALALAMPSQFRTTVVTLEGFVKSLLFIPSVDPKAPLLLLGWTLDFEVFFYVVFAALFFLKSGARTLAICAIFAVLIAVGETLHEPSHVVAFYTSNSLVGFCAGTVLAQAYRRGWLAARGWLPTTLAALALIGCFYAVPWDGPTEIGFELHLLMTAAAICIVCASLMVEAAGRLPRLSALRSLGDASYSIYLFHIFPAASVWVLGRKLFDTSYPPAYALVSMLAIAAGLAVGHLCYRLVEKPWLNLRHGGRKPTPAPAKRALAESASLANGRSAAHGVA